MIIPPSPPMAAAAHYPRWSDLTSWDEEHSNSWFASVPLKKLEGIWRSEGQERWKFGSDPDGLSRERLAALIPSPVDTFLEKSALPSLEHYDLRFQSPLGDRVGEGMSQVLSDAGLSVQLACRGSSPECDVEKCDGWSCGNDAPLRQFGVPEHTIAYWFEDATENLVFPTFAGIQPWRNRLYVFRPMLVSNREVDDWVIKGVGEKLLLPALITKLFGYSEQAFGVDRRNALRAKGELLDRNPAQELPEPVWWMKDVSYMYFGQREGGSENASLWLEPVSNLLVMGYAIPLDGDTCDPAFLHGARAILDFASRVIQDGVNNPMGGMSTGFHQQLGSEYVVLDKDATDPGGRQFWTSLSDAVWRTSHANDAAREALDTGAMAESHRRYYFDRSAAFGFGTRYPEMLFVYVRDLLLPHGEWDRAREVLAYEVPGGGFRSIWRSDSHEQIIEVKMLALLSEMVNLRWLLYQEDGLDYSDLDELIEEIQRRLYRPNNPWWEPEYRDSDSSGWETDDDGGSEYYDWSDLWCGEEYTQSLLAECEALVPVVRAIWDGRSSNEVNRKLESYLRRYDESIGAMVLRAHFGLRHHERSLTEPRFQILDFPPRKPER